jgi:Fe-S-cluster containining protein
MIVPLSRPYAGRHGLPVVDRLDPRIFVETYYAACMDCSYCYDSCCQYGATLGLPRIGQILAHADGLEPLVGVPRTEWFQEGSLPSNDYPSGRFTRTRVVDGSCVFLNRHGRGCLLHRYALENGLDVHDVKPMVCTMFPVLAEKGILIVPDEIRDRSLTCTGPGPTLYRSARDELLLEFGPELIAELDALEATTIAAHRVPDRALLSLPVVPALGGPTGPPEGQIAV